MQQVKLSYTRYEYLQLPLLPDVDKWMKAEVGVIYRTDSTTLRMEHGCATTRVCRFVDNSYGRCISYREVRIIQTPDSRVLI